MIREPNVVISLISYPFQSCSCLQLYRAFHIRQTTQIHIKLNTCLILDIQQLFLMFKYVINTKTNINLYAYS